MRHKKITKTFYCIILLMFFSTSVPAQTKETFESVVKDAISKGIIKKNGYKVVYIAAPSSDTVKVRSYYEDLIKKSGKPYQFSFESNAGNAQPKLKNVESSNKIIVPKPKSTDDPSTINIENGNAEKPMVPATTTGTPGSPVTPGDGACWARQKVYGELHYSNKVNEYTFYVPPNVTSIKIDAWSGGGNGFTKFSHTERIAHEIRQELVSGITGGGGGGGAFASAVIPVKKGDQVFITIPPGGGGKSVQVKLNGNENIFYLNNGGDGNEEGLNGKRIGGNSGGAYGVFKNNLYWLSGEEGLNALFTNYTYTDAPNGDGLLLPAGIASQQYDLNFGKGGSAALLNNGGRGAYLLTSGLYQRNTGGNGGFPGGGGGGGDTRELTSFNAGKGAPGMVIIHY